MPDNDTLLAKLLDVDWGGFTDDLPFYEALARRSDGPILELGCGTGRVALHLARAGHDVWGIDTSEDVLAFARCRAADRGDRLQLQRADMRDFHIGEKFGLIFAGFGAFHHLLTPADQLACLRCVEAHLAPAGLFVCDLRPLLDVDWDTGESGPLLHDWTRELPGRGITVTKLRSVIADRWRQVHHETHFYDLIGSDGTLRRVTAAVDLRFTTRYEMEGLLREAGLEVDQIYGDYDLGPYNGESEYMITVARRPEAAG
jgi:SAM-dependent methyltransferase